MTNEDFERVVAQHDTVDRFFDVIFHDGETGAKVRKGRTTIAREAHEDRRRLLDYVRELREEVDKFKLCVEHYAPSLPCGGKRCYHKDEEG